MRSWAFIVLLFFLRHSVAQSGLCNTYDVFVSTEQTVEAFDAVSGFALGHFDGDGFVDAVAWSNSTPNDVRLYINQGDGFFEDGPWHDLPGVALAATAVDLNDDEMVDAFFCLEDGHGYMLYTGGGLADYVSMGSEGCTSVAAADLDGDGVQDLLLGPSKDGSAAARVILSASGSTPADLPWTPPDFQNATSHATAFFVADLSGSSDPEVVLVTAVGTVVYSGFGGGISSVVSSPTIAVYSAAVSLAPRPLFGPVLTHILYVYQQATGAIEAWEPYLHTGGIPSLRKRTEMQLFDQEPLPSVYGIATGHLDIVGFVDLVLAAEQGGESVYYVFLGKAMAPNDSFFSECQQSRLSFSPSALPYASVRLLDADGDEDLDMFFSPMGVDGPATLAPFGVNINTFKLGGGPPQFLGQKLFFEDVTPTAVVVPADGQGEAVQQRALTLRFVSLEETGGNGSVLQTAAIAPIGGKYQVQLFKPSASSASAGYRFGAEVSGQGDGGGFVFDLAWSYYVFYEEEGGEVPIGGGQFLSVRGGGVVKWSASISGWPFRNDSSSLRLRIEVESADSSLAALVSDSLAGSERVLTFETAHATASVALLTFAVADGDREVQATATWDGPQQAIFLEFPFFEESVFYDPQLEVVLTGSDDDADQDDGDRVTLLVVCSVVVPGVVLVVTAVAIAVGLTLFGIRRKRGRAMMKRVRTLSQSSSMTAVV